MERKGSILEKTVQALDLPADVAGLPRIELLGISTVAGNKEINFTTDNTLRVVDMLRSNVPVYRGCWTSMVAKL